MTTAPLVSGVRPVGETLPALAEAVELLEEKEALRLVDEALAAGSGALTVLHAVEEGMRRVGQRYEAGEIFLAGLIMAGEIFRGAVEIVRPSLPDEPRSESRGRVLLGTVAGDIHDIGKNAVALALTSFGFTVRDVGVNVPAERFLAEAQAFAPDIIGLSGLLSGAFAAMRDTVGLLRERAPHLPSRPALIIGGGTLDAQVATYVGTDYWTTDALEGVRICEAILNSRSKQ